MNPFGTTSKKTDAGVNQNNQLKPEKSYCTICRRGFASVRNFVAHNKTVHSHLRPFVCQFRECGKTFKYKQVLKKHALTHTGEKGFSCKQCPEKFTSYHRQLVHAKEFHFNGVITYSCTESGCGKAFMGNSDLQRHLLTHTEDKPFRCSRCGMSTNRKSNLERHFQKQHGFTKDEAKSEYYAAARMFLRDLNNEREIPDEKLNSVVTQQILKLDKDYKIWYASQLKKAIAAVRG